ncbi:hypothetical protein BDZ94DRAFT_1301489 [Collybia nuda]|uniref:Uncharacterized protein n=1 Tax=Collybia nuda TaxID=64659 RepID=A0A9P5XWV5_9AGAR|nr:hypothetical protein BDZ94DRAFT_1301489 [Collybia nuda]
MKMDPKGLHDVSVYNRFLPLRPLTLTVVLVYTSLLILIQISQMTTKNPNHNVFLFVLHTMDCSSVIDQPNGVLNNAPIIRYDPAQDQGSARYADVNRGAITFSPRVRGVTRQPPTLICNFLDPKGNSIVQEYTLPNLPTNRKGRIRRPDDIITETDQVLVMNNEQFSVPEVFF